MKFGLKKYLDYLSVRSTSIEEERTAQFLQNKIDKVELNASTQDVKSKVLPSSKITEICSGADDVDEELGLMLRTMYETATRFSGMNQLLWRDVFRDTWRGDELEPHQVFISKDRSKGKEHGIVDVSDQTLNELKQLYESRGADQDDIVFFPEMKLRSVYQKAWRFFDRQWPNYSTHYFRHSRLTHLGLDMHQEEDLDYPVIKERLRDYARHRDESTTEIYIEIVKEKIRQRNQSMEKYRSVEW